MAVPMVRLNDNHQIPQLGFGIWRIKNEDTAKAVENALSVGYRHIDTAKYYENEEGVASGIRAGNVAREDIFITSKLWNTDQGYDNAFKAFDESLKRLQTDYLDLYLIHWPVPSQDKFIETWKAFIRLKEEGRVKSIGVSNFRIIDLVRLNEETGVTPAVNQIELHPYFQQSELRLFHEKHHIATEAWGPLGRGAIFDEPVLKAIAASHKKSVAQIILRWHMEIGNIAIPKSLHRERMVENIDVFNFSLTAQDHEKILRLDKTDGRMGADPAALA